MSAPTMVTTGTKSLGRSAGRVAPGLEGVTRYPVSHVGRSVAAGTCLFMVASIPAFAESWTFVPSVSLLETLTNNVNLDPSSTRQGDLVSQLTPALSIVEKGTHTSVTGSIAAPIVLYVKTGAENNTVYPQVNLVGNAELVERLLFIDSAINVSQQFYNPFGPQPTNLSSATDNRYTTSIYRISPYIKGEAGNNISYLLRDDNIWNSLNGAPVTTNNSYTNQVIGLLRREPVPFGWQLDYNRSAVTFTDQSTQLMELGRVRFLHDPDPAVELGISGGYERNEFPLSSDSGPTYGVSAKWRPNERTALDSYWEHRFFGSSYGVNFDYRTPLSVWGVHVSRNITTYPQQLASLPAGGDISALLNNLFSSRIADPAERQTIVDNLIRDRGLPQSLDAPLNLYSQEVTLLESASASAGFVGARNTIFFSVFYVKSTPISGSGQALPPELANLNTNNNKQTGASAAWTHKLTELVSFTGSINWTRTVANPPFVETTNQGSVRALWTAPLSTRTSVFGGARYQVQTSNIPTNEYHEVAGFVGVNYSFQ